MVKALFFLGVLGITQPWAGPLENLKPGEWFEVPNSKMRDVRHNFDPNGGALWDISCVVDCWCGAAFDTKRERLVLWGGGHGQYGGNELYAFDMNTLAWERLNDPSPVDRDGNATYPDGTPAVPHTYGYLQYLQSSDLFYSFGQTVIFPGVGSSALNWTFNFNTKTWGQAAEVPSGGRGYSFSGVDLNSGFAWTHGGYSSARLCSYDPIADRWTYRNNRFDDYMGSGFSMTGAIDQKKQVFAAVGDGTVWTWDLKQAGNIKGTELNAAGATSIQGAYAAGFDYDPVSETFIAWESGRDVYSLNLDQKTWTKHTTSGANPGANSGNGTYGRFRYSPKFNVFVVYNDVDENVFVYRHTAPTTAPSWYQDLLSGLGTRIGNTRLSAKITSEFEVFPNPFKSVVSLRLAKAGKVSIFDSQGKLVKKLETGNREQDTYWNAAPFPSGIYWAVAESAKGRVFRRLTLLK